MFLFLKEGQGWMATRSYKKSTEWIWLMAYGKWSMTLEFELLTFRAVREYLLLFKPTFHVFCYVGPRKLTGEGNGTPLQYSCLENPMDRGAW